MPGARIVGVIACTDGHAGFSVVDLNEGAEIAARRMPWRPLAEGGPYPHYDVETAWSFICDAARELAAQHPLDALSTMAHGACAALIDGEGRLCLPILDSGHAGPDELRAEYDAVRPEFTETFSPRLPLGQNLGAQLFWLQRRFPDDFARTRWILPLAQYFGFLLTGVAAAELTSLGCHTDLWSIETGLYSTLVMRQGWLDLMPEVRQPAALLGPLRADVAERLGLSPGLDVLTGINDDSAALLPHFVSHKLPFSVVSGSGEWTICATPGGDLATLDPERGCFSSIDAFGRPVPSATFMGGREFEVLTGGAVRTPWGDAVAHALEQPVLILPSVQQGSGPFPHRTARWQPAAEGLDAETRFAAISFYLAMMTAECLGMTGGEDGDIIVEGPFARNLLYLQMLFASTGRRVLADATSATGTTFGAALLASRAPARVTPPVPVQLAGESRARMARYAAAWRQAVGAI